MQASSIPVIGIATLNQLDTLKQLIQSIDYPVDVCSVVCNRDSIEYFQEVRKVCANPLVKEFVVSFCPYNLGCAGSWNYHIKHNSSAAYWLLVNDDVCFATGDLRAIDTVMQTAPMVFCKFPNCASQFSAFAVSNKTVDTVGLFDENFYPAYFEDDDYWRRCKYHNIQIERVAINGNHIGSGTLKNLSFDDQRKLRIEYWNANENYYRAKINKGVYNVPPFSLLTRSQKLMRVK